MNDSTQTRAPGRGPSGKRAECAKPLSVIVGIFMTGLVLYQTVFVIVSDRQMSRHVLSSTDFGPVPMKGTDGIEGSRASLEKANNINPRGADLKLEESSAHLVKTFVFASPSKLESSKNNDNQVAENEATTEVEASNVMACVEKAKNGSCQMYACNKHEDGKVTRIDNNNKQSGSNDIFGYPGHFVHRDKNVQRKSMSVASSSANWDAGCAVSEKYRFVYIHVLKSGGSSTKEFIRKGFCGEDDEHCKKVDKHIIKPIGCQNAVRGYPDYFFFSFARNPFSRMFSMYSMMDGFPKARGRGVRGGGSSETVTENFSFEDFVLHPRERAKHTMMSPSHYTEQNKFLFSRDGCPSFDYLGRLDHYDEDMRTILNHVQAKELIEYMDSNGGKVTPVNTWGSGKKKTLDGGLRAAYASNQNVIESVANSYRRDFDLLGYNTSEIPVH